MQGCFHHVDMLAFFIFILANAIICFFAIFVLVTVDVVCVKSVRLKHIDCLYHFLQLNYRGLLAQILIYGDKESNQGPTQNDFKSLYGRSKKMKVFKGTLKKFDLSENSNISVSSDRKVQNIFFNTILSLS